MEEVRTRVEEPAEELDGETVESAGKTEVQEFMEICVASEEDAWKEECTGSRRGKGVGQAWMLAPGLVLCCRRLLVK